jgi:hypothetical protein
LPAHWSIRFSCGMPNQLNPRPVQTHAGHVFRENAGL